MKKINHIKRYLAFTIPVIAMISCSDDDVNGVTFQENAAAVSIAPSRISTLDQNTEFTVTATSANEASVESVVISLQGENVSNLTEIGTVSLVGNEGTISLSSATLDLSLEEANKDQAVVHLTTSGIAPSSTSIKTISIYNPVDASATSSVIEAETTINDTLKYEITTSSAEVDRVIIEQKVFFDGTYTEIPAPTGDWHTSKSEYIFQGEDFTLNDTIYFKVTAFSGALSAVGDEVKVFVDTQRIDGISGGATLNTTTSNYNLLESSLIADPEITFDNTIFGFKAAASTQITFVKITSSDATEIFDEKDLLRAEAAYDLGTPVNEISNVQPNDVYVYKIQRTNEDGEQVNSTGLIKIDVVSVINNTNSFEFSYAEEEDAVQ
ncbi:hypothetical protein [Aquimarina intermedia]|uniref:Uncharacterized protein n=1 Tax=Aquimarina intermedia TaxID=350814 RepID=A0A5S5C233_9FLAO|nr:hypothetical protein [Aquimarina intermedia]TYP73481.1 hypothetical protein BD809_10568 [Aquimarina intermedia]